MKELNDKVSIHSVSKETLLAQVKVLRKELQETKRTAKVELLRALEKKQASKLKEQHWAKREEDLEEARRSLVQRLEEAWKRS